MSIRGSITVKQILKAADPDNEWYNDDDLVSTHKHWLIETSDRGYGKSTRTALRFMAEYIVHGKKWLYLRRTDNLLNSTKQTFFDGAREIINECNLGFQIAYFVCDGGRYYMKVEYNDENNDPPALYDKNGEKVDLEPAEYEEALQKYRRKTAEQCGLAMALSTGEEEAKSGGTKFKGVKYGVFDEFIAERSTKYLGSIDDPDVEYEALYSIYVSVAREKNNPFLDDVYFYMLGNWSHSWNPILLNLGANEYIAQSPGAHIIAPKAEEWAIEFIEPTEGFKKKQRESVQYKLAQHSKKTLEYTFNNRAKDELESESLVVKDIPKGASYYSGLILNRKQYGVYYRASDGLIYIGNMQAGRHVEALDIASYYDGSATMLTLKWRDSPVLNMIYERFLFKKVLFKNKDAQRAFMMYLDFIPR